MGVDLSDSLLAQYESYRRHRNVNELSPVPTYARIRVMLPGWETVKMYPESGKALPERKAGIIVNFKDGGELFFDIHNGIAIYKGHSGKRDEYKLKQDQRDPSGKLVWG